MNLFVLHEDPAEAATMLCDQHVRKMILETVQIIDGGTRPVMRNLIPREACPEIVAIPYSQRDNPCIHTTQSATVAAYAWGHFLGLLSEFQYRFGKSHSYDTGTMREALWNRLERAQPGMNMKGFGLFMPDAYKSASDRRVPLDQAILSYRNYYAGEKHTFASGPAVWTRAAPPQWLVRAFISRGFDWHSSPDNTTHFFKERTPA